MTAQSRPQGAELKRFLGGFGPEIAKIALRVRALVLGEAPLAHELVYEEADGGLAMGYSFNDRPVDCFCHMTLFAGWVQFGFDEGARIPDPGGLLRGSGRRFRHLRIESLEGLREPHVGRFLRAALREARKETATTEKDRE